MVDTGNEDILKLFDLADVGYGVHPRIGRIGHDQIHLAVVQKVHAPGGGLIGHLNVHIRKMGVKFL